MSESMAKRLRMLRLEFPDDGREKAVRDNLSAVAASGDGFWFGTDEGTLLDRLRQTDGDRYAGHASFELKDWLTLPNTTGKKDEIDIEGLCVADGRLWMVGSHAAVRDKAEPEKGAEKAIKELTEVKRRANRWTLAAFELRDDGASLGSAASLPNNGDTTPLLEALAGDPHLEPFLSIPAKDNGFDIEGLAVLDQRVFLGLRGPVLRGWAVLLEFKIERDGDRLELKPNGPEGRRYRKHFLELEGCGLRDLALYDGGKELLLLAGPTMALDGTIRLHRWRVPGQEGVDTITVKKELDCSAVMTIPHRRGKDRAEGIELLPGAKGPELLVVYDNPDVDRGSGESIVYADVFAPPL
jgi:hypothetical protein